MGDGAGEGHVGSREDPREWKDTSRRVSSRSESILQSLWIETNIAKQRICVAAARSGLALADASIFQPPCRTNRVFRFELGVYVCSRMRGMCRLCDKYVAQYMFLQVGQTMATSA